MKKIILEFHGYTWDEYFYVIAHKHGILVTYKGGLDSKSFIRLDEILFVDEADELIKIYESEHLKEIRASLGSNDRLFFSFSEMDKEGRSYVVETLTEILRPRFIFSKSKVKSHVSCIGSCALFPEEIKAVSQKR